MSTAHSTTSASASAHPKALPASFSWGVLGLVAGAGVCFAILHSLGYVDFSSEEEKQERYARPPFRVGMGGMGGGMGGMGGGMGGPGGGMGGGPGMGGGNDGARNKRGLTSLVGRLNLLTRSDLRVELSPEQRESVAEILVSLQMAEELSGDEAKGRLDALSALLTEEQLTALDAVGLPFPRPGMGGGPGGMGGGGMGGGGMGMGGQPDPKENPFNRDVNKDRLDELLSRVRPESDKAPTGDAPTNSSEGTPPASPPAEAQPIKGAPAAEEGS